MGLEREDDARLAFDRQKWADEKGLRLQELCLKTKAQLAGDADLELKRVEQSRSRWLNPLTVAVFSAAVVGAVNIWVTNTSGALQRSIEASKEDFDLILEVVKDSGGDLGKTSTYLQLLVEAGLIENTARISLVQRYLATVAQQAAIPSSAAAGWHILVSPKVDGMPVDICSGSLPRNDCSPTGLKVAATQVCIANGFKSAATYSVGEWRGNALHWDGAKFLLLPSGAIFTDVECAG